MVLRESPHSKKTSNQRHVGVVVAQVLPETHVYRTGVRHAPGTRVLHGR